MEEQVGAPFGSHRVLEPRGALPQPAWKLDNDTSARWDNEIVVDVATLNVDAASFRQMEEATVGEPDGVARLVLETVHKRGKQHNPVTGSGGMLLGTVRSVGSRRRGEVEPGERIATLASLSLTPLRIEKILAIRPASAQLDVVGQAVMADGAPYAKMPSDMPERLALAILDVAGAAIQVERRAKRGERILVLGAGGKSGLLCAVQARAAVGPERVVVGLESHPKAADELRALGVCNQVISGDATDALGVHRAAIAAGGGEFDMAVCCVNVESAEMATILPVRQGGCAYFFSMTTHFGRAALGAEGVGKDVELIIGNGFARGHADHALSLVRREPALRAVLERRYG
jgi:L-erythro-3,5-diaminohexanoate dehydrogenase